MFPVIEHECTSDSSALSSSLGMCSNHPLSKYSIKSYILIRLMNIVLVPDYSGPTKSV